MLFIRDERQLLVYGTETNAAQLLIFQPVIHANGDRKSGYRRVRDTNQWPLRGIKDRNIIVGTKLPHRALERAQVQSAPTHVRGIAN